MSPTESPFTDPTLSPQAPSASPTASPSSTPSATPSASPSAAPSWGPAPASHFEFMTESQLNSQIDRWIAEDGVADYSDRCPGIFRPLSGSLLRCNRGGSVRCCVSILAEQHTKFECKVHGYLCNPGVFTDCLGVPGGGPVRSYIVQSANLSQPRVSQVKCEKEKLTPEVVILDFTVSNPPDTVLECLPKIDGAGKFYELLEKAGLFRADQLSGMTLFAFADHAYEALTSGVRGMLELKPTENSSDSSVLRLLRAHVAHGQSFIQQSGSAVTLTPRPGAPVPDPHCDSSRCPMRDGSEVLVEGQQGTAVVTPQCATPNCGANSAVVAERNIACSDSVVHLISSTLATPAMGLPTKTISDVLSERNSSFLSVAAAVMSKLLPVDGPEALTCFVPTNVAMDSSLRNTSSAFHSADWRPVLTTNLTHNSLGSGLPILTDENISRVLVFHCSRGYVWLPKWGANDTTPIDPLGPCTDPDCSTANTTEKVFVSFVHPDSPTFDGLGPGEERSGVLVVGGLAGAGCCAGRPEGAGDAGG
eukprot:TRINITY_DN15948_c0_g1_i2.p1 TRINITY_DN15948_c0_g1~~TRINITY_DN15948_c0_g1_i2.p1  ORF type:complete len:588 (+),score=175.84 TRINITY_DN15948_c0_g1_i2:167-1765(+)